MMYCLYCGEDHTCVNDILKNIIINNWQKLYHKKFRERALKYNIGPFYLECEKCHKRSGSVGHPYLLDNRIDIIAMAMEISDIRISNFGKILCGICGPTLPMKMKIKFN